MKLINTIHSKQTTKKDPDLENPEVTAARDEAASAIKLAHQMAEIVGWLVADLRAAQVLRPQTATNILHLVTEDSHSPLRSRQAISRLRERLLSGQSPLEQEMKKDVLWKPDD